MTQFEMTEKLAAKCNVTLEEAKDALENGNWNTLTATHLLEQAQFRRMQELNAINAGGAAMAVQAAPQEPEADALTESQTDTGAQAEAASATTAQAEAIDSDAKTAEQVEQAVHAKEKKRRGNQGLKNVGEHIRRLIACGNRNRFEIRKDGKSVMELPVTVLVLALVCAFWVCVPLLVIGLFTGCRYSFGGRELGRAGLNDALAKAADVAERMKQNAAKA